MENFWDYNVWGVVNLLAVLLASLLAANVLRKSIPFLRSSLIPNSVLGGGFLIAVAGLYKLATGEVMFDTPFFGGSGTAVLELATYLLQGVFGLGISMVGALVLKGFFSAAGILLPFGYGQGTGQALNYGNIFETEYGFSGGKSFGLTIAALGFLSASIGGVIHLNILKKRGKIHPSDRGEAALRSEQIQSENEIPMQESMDTMTVQIALIFGAYLLAYLLMFGLGKLLPGMKSVVYGYNFLPGVLTATLVKLDMGWLKKKRVIKKEYANTFLMTRASNFFFDVMVVAGIAAIRFGVLQNYWGIILIMGLVGLIIIFI